MAEENIHKQEFLTRNLLTRSVTLYPSRAQIIRDINDITLKPGANEITIYGFTPTADENSIKVEGKGSATITDMMVDLVPNRDNYEDVYPEESDDGDSDSTDDAPDPSENEPSFSKARAQEKQNNEKLTKQANEEKNSALGQLAMLEKYAKSIENCRPKDLENCITLYREQRERVFHGHFASEAKLKDLQKEHDKIEKKYNKAWKAFKRESEKETKKRLKELERKRRTRQEKCIAHDRLKQERIRFWPRKVYRIILSLDTNSDITPASSRRGSVDSLAKTLSEDSFSSCHISLSVSYVTHSAWWSPHYDLSLSTPTSTGTILYRAEFGNTTSETWKDAKIILSTSQTAFQGLGDPIPLMQPWHIRLNKNASQFGDAARGVLLSKHEIGSQQGSCFARPHKIREPRDELFGLGNDFVPSSLLNAHLNREDQQRQQMMQLFVPQQTQRKSLFGAPAQQMPARGGLFDNANRPSQSSVFGGFSQSSQSVGFGDNQQSSLFGAPAQQIAAPSTSGGLFGSASGLSQPNGFGQGSQSEYFGSVQQSSVFGAPTQQVPGSSTGGGLFGNTSGPSQPVQSPQGVGIDDGGLFGSDQTIIPELPSLATQESEWSETGMTTTYDIPGQRTIAPSDTMRRHRIAAIELKTVHLSYQVVPKLRTAAFLKARIRNTSNIALLKGPAGLTLDGTFLGNSSLPRCSTEESFSLSLGVDPSVTVTYSKPVVKRSQTGFLQRDGTGVYTRVCTITNTRSDRPLNGVVLDQIPVSDDERLKVDILQPSGLRNENDTAIAGTGISAVGKVTDNWGTAKATVKKAGEISWNINIEPSRGVKLLLTGPSASLSNSDAINHSSSKFPTGRHPLQGYEKEFKVLEEISRKHQMKTQALMEG